MRKIMKKAIFAGILSLAVLFLQSESQAAQMTKKEYLNATLYTQTNMWNEMGKPILSTNFHRGDMIPAGSLVSIDSIRGKTVSFTVSDTGTQYALLLSKRHSKLNIYELIDRYFGIKNPMKGIYKKFSKDEKSSVDAGIITEGMSKEAVLMAYGYPPTHRTPSIEMDVWNYWENRVRRFEVFFNKDDKVVRLNGITF